MSRNFKRFLLQLRLDPLAFLQAAGFAVFFFLTYASLEGRWLLCAAAWVLLFALLEWLASRGWSKYFLIVKIYDISCAHSIKLIVKC